MITTINPAKLFVGFNGKTYVKVSPWLFNNMRKDCDMHYFTMIPIAGTIYVLTDIPDCKAHLYDGKSLTFSYTKDEEDTNMYKLHLYYCGYNERYDPMVIKRQLVSAVGTKLNYADIVSDEKRRTSMFGIRKVIFNAPATIVFWTDGTKTVVKCAEHEEYDAEKGLAMCFAKKALGNIGHYYEEFKKWLHKEEVVNPSEEQIEEIKKMDKVIKENPIESENTWGF